MPISPIRQEYEDVLWGLIPKAAEAVVNAEIVRRLDHIRKLQVEAAEIQQILKDLRNGNWPKDENGFLTFSPDNPL